MEWCAHGCYTASASLGFASMNETSADSGRLVSFGDYELDLRSGELRKAGALE